MNVNHFLREVPTLFFLVTAVVCHLYGQNSGTIQGKIVDAQNGEGLAGANVVLKGTIMGASSGPNGSFRISGIPEGEYQVIISFIGYVTAEEFVTMGKDKETALSVRLQPGAIELSAVLVEADRPYSAASSRTVRQYDLKLRPNRSAQDMLQLAPGLIIVQHGGGGKAEQIYIRGFDTDHGTDIAIFTDGIPVNMVSHGHGQGYADLHFLIPEIVESIDVYKGPYFAPFGNLATAGSVSFRTKDRIEKNLLRVEGGKFNTGKFTTLLQIPTAGEEQNAYFAGQFYTTDGPFESPQKFRRFNLFGKFHTHVSGNSKLAFSLGAFSTGWDQSGQIPQRAVDIGQIGRFGAIDDLEGGTTSRLNILINYTIGQGTDREFYIQGFATRCNFKLFSNFTFFLNDSIRGDMIEQTDTRNIAGLDGRYRFRKRVGSTLAITSFGGGFRSDNINVSLWKSPDRMRQYPRVDSDMFERNFFLWLEQEFVFNTMWRLQLGLRADYFTFNVDDKLELENNSDLPHASGYEQEAMINPKFNLVCSPLPSTDIFVNFGGGYHSNDARNVVIARRMEEIDYAVRRRGATDEQIDSVLLAKNFNPDQRNIRTLARALGAELGLRTQITRQFVVGLAAWWLHLEEELVYVGDEGTTEVSGETRRIGLDVEARFQFAPWLWADSDINLANGRFVNEPEGTNDIPLAPRASSTGGITAIQPGHTGIEGTFRYRYISDRPGNEFNTITALGSTVFDIGLGYRFRNFKILGYIQNLFDVDWNEAQFDTESRLQNELHPVSELHFTPGNPRNFQMGLSYEF